MQPPGPEPIAVDPGYRLRDNQFWYTDCQFAGHLAGAARITLRVDGLGVRTLARAAPGRDGRSTTSFTLSDRADRAWWEQRRGRRVRVELLTVYAGHSVPAAPPPGPSPALPIRLAAPELTREKSQPAPTVGGAALTGPVLCIGLDVAWFGGSAGNPDSQFDCLAWACLASEGDASPPGCWGLERVALRGRDPSATQLLDGIDALLKARGTNGRVVFAVDAPIQASPRPHLGVRPALPAAGQSQRRACEDHLEDRRREIDRAAGGTGGWRPNIQPGAPLASRVSNLLGGLCDRGFSLWTEANRGAAKLVVECFPAEAIWAMKRLGRYPATLTAAEVKAYKQQGDNHLTAQQVRELVRRVLAGFAVDSGVPDRWDRLVEDALAWMLADGTWQSDPGKYRGGKLLDDVVDSMICLATASGYAHGLLHVWQDPAQPEDGHIIGPGKMDPLL